MTLQNAALVEEASAAGESTAEQANDALANSFVIEQRVDITSRASSAPAAKQPSSPVPGT